MKKQLLLALALGILATSSAQAGCPEVKSAIDAKIQAKGVRNYSLDIVGAADVGSARVVGNCDGGKSRIVYSRGAAGAKASAAAPAASPAPAAAAKPAKAEKPAAPPAALGNY